VGPDAFELDKSVEMADNFVATEAYLALIKGAIYYSMKALNEPFDTIEALAVGLPNSNFVRDKQILKDVLLRTHTIPLPSKFSYLQKATMDVKIEKILALPQPLGSQTAYLMQQQATELKNETNLVIDIGFNTLDWLSIKSVSIDSSHSGSINAGVSQVLQALSSSISKQHGIERLEFYDTQKAYLDGFFIYKGKKILTNQLQSIVESKCDEIVNRFKNNIKKYDYDNLILTGGGAPMYANSIHQQFEDLKLITLPNPVFANVLGFYCYAKNLKQV
jgi:plasmid segregation protein ParM